MCAGGHVQAWRAPPASQAAAFRHMGRPTAPSWPAWCCRPSCRGLKLGRSCFLSIRMVARIATKTVVSPACSQIFSHMSPPLDPLARSSTQNLGVERSHGPQNNHLARGRTPRGVFGVCTGGHTCARATWLPPRRQLMGILEGWLGRVGSSAVPSADQRGPKRGFGRFQCIYIVAEIAAKTVRAFARTQFFLHLSPPFDPLG